MRAAIWLMECFGVADALIGDLVEASKHHGSLWLWRQASGAIAVALAKDIGAHPVLALRAIVVGIVLLDLSRPPLEWVWRQVNLPFSHAVFFLGLQHQNALASAIVRTMLFMPATFGIGWLLARLHQTRTPAMVLTFLAVIWFLDVPGFWRLLLNATDQARFRPYLAVNLISLLVFNVSVIAGAFLAKTHAGSESARPGDRPSHEEALT